MAILRDLLDTSRFVAPRSWGAWTPQLVRLGDISDTLIGLAYLAILAVLVDFARRRRDIPSRRTFWFSGVFIASCGLTHLLEVVAPLDRLVGVVKLLTAVSSWATVLALVPLVPRALAVRGPAEWEREIDERRRAEESLRRSEAKFRSLLEFAPDPIVITDVTGRIDLANAQTGRMFGYDAEELIGQPVEILLPESLREAHAKHRADYFAAPCVRPMGSGRELHGRRKDGTTVPVEISLGPLETERGLVATSIIRDITERRQAEEALRRAKEEAEAANRAKDRFLAALSHELRNPLNPVLMAATAMLHQPETPTRLRATLEMIRRNVELEARLIDDLLDVSRIIQGKMSLHREVVDAHALVRRSLDTCGGDLEAGQIEPVLDLAAADHHVEADPVRLQQVLWNLIKNAAKFTPPGGRITIESRDGADGRLVIRVVDTGRGIEPDVLARIFDPFDQGGDSVTRRFGGLGLGLSISRSIVAAHGGRLSAESEGPGRGAAFLLELAPVPAPAGGEPEGVPASASPPGDRDLRLLLVEDDPIARDLMGQLLGQWGYDVTTAGSVAGGLEVADRDFDLIVSDVGLPDGTGLDLLRSIKARRDILGIALTGYGEEEDIARSREAGFAAHLTKPIDFARLDEVIREVAIGPRAHLPRDPAGV